MAADRPGSSCVAGSRSIGRTVTASGVNDRNPLGSLTLHRVVVDDAVADDGVARTQEPRGRGAWTAVEHALGVGTALRRHGHVDEPRLGIVAGIARRWRTCVA